MPNPTTAELHDRFVAAVEDRDLDRAARLEGRIRTSRDPIPDLLDGFVAAVEGEDFERAKTLLREIQRGYADRRVEEDATARRVAHARDSGALADEDVPTAEAFLRDARALATERLSFLSNAIVFVEHRELVGRGELREDAEALNEDEAAIREGAERAAGAIDGAKLPPGLEVLDVATVGTVTVDEAVTLSVTLYNSGGRATEGIEPTVEAPRGIEVESTPPTVASLTGDATRTVEFEVRPTETGEFALAVEAASANAGTALERTTIEVTGDGDPPSVEDYTGDDDVVDATGLQEAVRDWARGEIDTDLLRAVIAVWESGEPVD